MIVVSQSEATLWFGAAIVGMVGGLFGNWVIAAVYRRMDGRGSNSSVIIPASAFAIVLFVFLVVFTNLSLG